MKITLDLPSVITGGAVALVLGLVAGFTPQVTQVPGAINVAPRQITGQFSPHPSDFVWLHADPSQSSPLLTVPQGKILVLTGLSSDQLTGTSQAYSKVDLEIDGVAFPFQFLRVKYYSETATALSQNVDFHNGVPLTEGQTVQLTGMQGSFAWLHGYWADA